MPNGRNQVGDKDFRLKLNELMAEIGTLSPQEHKVVRVLTESTYQEGTHASTPIQRSFDFLRLSIKYMLFDLEATRRETQFLHNLFRARHDPEVDDG